MSKISAMIYSEALLFRTHLEVIIPQNPTPATKVLYLLHGITDDCTAWGRNTRIYHYAEKYNYIVIMPEVQRSFYSDMKHGSKYFTYVAHELPQTIERLFNVRHARENTFVAGLSMGGYGAAKCALSRPEFYTACGCFSGAMDLRSLFEDSYAGRRPLFPETPAILGEALIFPDNADLFHLASNVPPTNKPRLLITCGDKDFLLDGNRRFDAHLQKLNYGHKYMEWPGVHDWNFWEECLPLAFDFFEEQK